MIDNKAFNEEVVFTNSIKYLLISAGILFILFFKNISIPVGLLFGGIAALINYRIIIYSVRKMVGRRTVNKLSFSGLFILRMTIIIFIITYAIKLNSINLVTAVIGLFWVRSIIYAEAIIRHFKEEKPGTQ